jgi:3-hydroxyisobutyrate dehydrogenase-like beta-hydroxyacid dehydrogenase
MQGTVGFVGLGNMGSTLASNLAQVGFDVVAHDVLGPQRTPEGVTYAHEVAEVACRGDVVVLSLPDGAASEQVARAILAVPIAALRTWSTPRRRRARSIARVAEDRVAYVDAGVGGVVERGPARSR